MNELENLCFELISYAGDARSNFIEAIDLSREGKFKEALSLIDKGNEEFVEGHTAHAKILSEHAKGNNALNEMLLMHAEDMMMSAENFGIIAKNDLHLYQMLYDLKDR